MSVELKDDEVVVTDNQFDQFRLSLVNILGSEPLLCFDLDGGNETVWITREDAGELVKYISRFYNTGKLAPRDIPSTPKSHGPSEDLDDDLLGEGDVLDLGECLVTSEDVEEALTEVAANVGTLAETVSTGFAAVETALDRLRKTCDVITNRQDARETMTSIAFSHIRTRLDQIEEKLAQANPVNDPIFAAGFVIPNPPIGNICKPN